MSDGNGSPSIDAYVGLSRRAWLAAAAGFGTLGGAGVRAALVL